MERDETKDNVENHMPNMGEMAQQHEDNRDPDSWAPKKALEVSDGEISETHSDLPKVMDLPDPCARPPSDLKGTDQVLLGEQSQMGHRCVCAKGVQGEDDNG